MLCPIWGYRYDDKHMWTHEDFDDDEATAEEGKALRPNPGSGPPNKTVTQHTHL